MLTVSGLNQAVARMLERNFPLIWVKGEISFTAPPPATGTSTSRMTAPRYAVMFKARPVRRLRRARATRSSAHPGHPLRATG
jgi:exonuclease VII large subunit